MLHIWDAVEADFMRDYGIDLEEQLDTLSWRKFLVLLHNLNPHGAVAYRYEAERNAQKKRARREGLAGKEAADTFFSSLMAL